MFVPVLIVGSGIAGMSVAFNLSKKNIDYLIITKAEHYLKSNSTIAPANMRLFNDYKKGINLYMEQCCGNYKTIESIYSNQIHLINTLNELNIDTKKTPIGVIPINSGDEKEGAFLLKKLKENVEKILTQTFLVDIRIHKNYIECLTFNKFAGFIHINCGVLVISTGGFANLFEYNDNSSTATGECTYLLQKYTNKLKGISTIMFHPFGIQKGKRILTGDIASLIENIYEKDKYGNLIPLEINEEILQAIKSNSYHSNKIFTGILEATANKEVYIKFADKDINNIKQKLINLKYSSKILVNNNFIKINSTAHYTSGGIVVDEQFKVTDRIFANGEIIFDGNKGIGRLPGHAFSSAIISGKIISNSIDKIKIQAIKKEQRFNIEDKITIYDDIKSLEYEKLLKNYAKECSNLLMSKNINTIELTKIKEKMENTIEEIDKNINSIKLLNIYYSINLLYNIIQEKLKELK